MAARFGNVSISRTAASLTCRAAAQCFFLFFLFFLAALHPGAWPDTTAAAAAAPDCSVFVTLHLKDTIPEGPAEGTGNGLFKARWQSAKWNISTPREDPLHQARSTGEDVGVSHLKRPDLQISAPPFFPSTLRRLSCCADTK